MATIDISPSAGTPASTGYLIYTDATTGTFKKAPLSALPLSDTMVTALAAKQATLVSGTNIKTLDGNDIVGSGDLTVSGGINDPFTAHTGTTWNGTLKYRVLNANLALTLVTALQSGMILFKQDGTGGRTVSIEGEDLPINLDPGKWSSVGFTKAGSEYLVMVNPTIISVTPAADVTPPGIVRLEAIDGTHIEAELDENVTTTGITGWSFKKNGSAFVPSGVSGGGTDTLTFTFATSILDSDTLLASYNSGTGDTEDTSGNELVSFTDSAVTNSVDSTAPTLVSATVENATPTHVDLVFNEDMDSTWSAAAAFTVSGHTVTAVTRVTATTGYLTVSSAFTNGEAARTLAYTEPGSNKMKDLVGNLLATFSGTSITNNVGAADTTAPTLLSATVENATPTRIDLVFDEAMNATWSAASAFTVTGHTVSSVTRTGATTGYVTVSVAFTSADTETLAYTAPGSNKMQDLAGNLLANIAAESIVNNVAGPVILSNAGGIVTSGTPLGAGIALEVISIVAAARVTTAGTADTVKFHTNAVPTGTLPGVVFRVWRKTGSLYDVVGETQLIPVGTIVSGLNTHAITTPFAVQVGDYISMYYTGTNPAASFSSAPGTMGDAKYSITVPAANTNMAWDSETGVSDYLTVQLIQS